MARVIFGSNLQRHLTRPAVAAFGATVGEVMGQVFKDDPLLRSYVLDDQGRLRKHVNIFLNNSAIQDRVKLGDGVRENDEIYIFQALSGG